jgi:uncharacterized sporulation protein YeaH/YhbH (DUF444 family)
MSIIIDRRKINKGKSYNNRQKFLKRIEHKIKKALPDIIQSESIKDNINGGKVKIPIKGISEPSFKHDGKSGNKKFISPGNDKYQRGDKIKKPENGSGNGGGKGSKDAPIGEDQFEIIISRKEFLKYFFDDLELPNLVKKHLESTEEFEYKRAGFVKYSIPPKLSVKKSFEQALARKLAISGALKIKIEKLKEQIKNCTDLDKLKELEEELQKAEKYYNSINFMENVDLRYRNYEKHPVPITSAVMFCVMDVSYSMGEHEKDISKRFFTLLYLFLMKNYKNVEIVFIRHHTEASEVTEKDFFESRESGGTIVAPALKLANKIINERYSAGWNVYLSQASDGDVWSKEDAYECRSIIQKDLLDKLQYMAYIEINKYNKRSDLWIEYNIIKDERFSIKKINEVAEIWPVFKKLFEKREK